MTGEMLKEWRESQDLTQAELAAKLSVDVMTISRWERGARAIPPFRQLALDKIEMDNSSADDRPNAPSPVAEAPSPAVGKPTKKAGKKSAKK